MREKRLVRKLSVQIVILTAALFIVGAGVVFSTRPMIHSSAAKRAMHSSAPKALFLFSFSEKYLYESDQAADKENRSEYDQRDSGGNVDRQDPDPHTDRGEHHKKVRDNQSTSDLHHIVIRVIRVVRRYYL